MTAAASVTVVIPTLNAGTILGDAIASVGPPERRTARVVVADGGSSDRTADVAREFGAAFLPGPFRRSSARRAGVEATDSEFVLFLDADQRLAPGAVDSAIGALEPARADAAFLPETDSASGPWAGCRALDRRLVDPEELAYPRLYRRSAYWASGGHRPGLEDFLEDRDLYLRFQERGLRAVWSSIGLVNELGRVDPLALGRKGARAAIDARRYFERHRGPAGGVRRLIGPRLRRLARGAAIRGSSPATLLLFPAYTLVVNGPRLLAAVTAR